MKAPTTQKEFYRIVNKKALLDYLKKGKPSAVAAGDYWRGCSYVVQGDGCLLYTYLKSMKIPFHFIGPWAIYFQGRAFKFSPAVYKLTHQIANCTFAEARKILKIKAAR